MGFSPKFAIPLSNLTVLGGACMNFVMNMKKVLRNTAYSRTPRHVSSHTLLPA